MRTKFVRNLAVVAVLVSACFSAIYTHAQMRLVNGENAQLQQKNTFAFNIAVDSTDPVNPIVSFDLAGLTEKVEVFTLLDGVQIPEKTITVTEGLKMSGNTVTVNLSDVPSGRVSFEIRAYNQTSVNNYHLVDLGYVASIDVGEGITFYCPTGITVNNCTDSDDFGRVIVTEGKRSPTDIESSTSISKHKTYYSCNLDGSNIAMGTGLYAFNPHMQPYVIDGGYNNGKRGFKAGLTTDHGTASHNTFQVAKYSDDGRLFLATHTDVSDYYPVYLLDPSDLQQPGSVFITGNLDSNGAVVDPSTSAVRAQPILGMDLFGKGENMKMALAVEPTIGGYNSKIYYYDLGAYYTNGQPASTWDREPTKVMTQSNGSITLSYTSPNNLRPTFSPDGTQLTVAQNRGTAKDSEPGFVTYDIASNTVLNTELINNASVIARNASGTLIARAEGGGKIKIYEVSDGHTIDPAHPKCTISVFNSTKVAAMDMAFDIADNLYVTNNSIESVFVYQIGNGRTYCDVPAPSKYAFDHFSDPEVSVEYSIDVDQAAVKLTWTQVNCRNAAAIRISRNGTALRTLTDTSVLSFTDRQAVRGENTYTVAYLNSDNSVIASKDITVEITPSIALKALYYANKVQLNWIASFENPTTDRVAVYQGDTLVGTFPVDDSSYGIVGAEPPYSFYVKLVSPDNEVLSTSNTESFSIRTEGATISVQSINTIDGRSTVTLEWKHTPTDSDLKFSHYSVLFNGQILYEKIGYGACTHNFVPEGTHQYVIRVNFDDGSFIDSAPVSIDVVPRDYSKPLYSLEEVYNYQIISPQERDALIAEGNYDENRFFVAEYPFEQMRYGISQYSSSPGDNYRQAVFKNGKWYLSLLNSSFIDHSNNPVISNYTKGTNTQAQNPYLFDDYISGGLTAGVTYGGILEIDANDPKSAYNKQMKDLRVVTTDPSTNQVIAIDEATDKVNIITRAGSSNVNGTSYKLTNSLNSYMYAATDYLSIFEHNPSSFTTFNGNPASHILNVSHSNNIRPLTYGETDYAQKGRVHYISASGDVSSAEGGYIYVAYNMTADVSRILVKNNEVQAIDENGSRNYNRDGVAAGTLYSGYTENYAFPIAHFNPVTLSAEEVANGYYIDSDGNKVDSKGKIIEYELTHLNNKYFVHQLRNTGYYLVNTETGEYTQIPMPSSDIRSAGGHTFVYDDGSGVELFWVHPRTSSANSFGNFAVELINLSSILDDENDIADFRDAFVNHVTIQSFSHEGLQGDANGNASGVWFGSEYSAEDNCMYIYEYCPGTRFAKYRFSSYTMYPPAADPGIELEVEKGGEGAYHPNDITHISNTMSWKRPHEFGATANSKYNIKHYIVKLVNAHGAVIRLNDCDVTYTMTDPATGNKVTGHIDQPLSFELGTEQGTILVPDPVGNINSLAAYSTKFTLDYSRSDLRNGDYTLYVTPVYRSIVSNAEAEGTLTYVKGTAGIVGAPYPITAQAFCAAGRNSYRVDLQAERPADNDTPVSYYTLEVKKKGSTEYEPLDNYFMIRNNKHYHYSSAASRSNMPAMHSAPSRAGEVDSFDGKIPGDYVFETEQGYFSHEQGAVPSIAYYYPTENPAGNKYQLTAHYGASNPAIAVDYSAETNAIPENDFIVTGIESTEADGTAIKAYPVPAHDVINISSGSPITTVEFYTTSGMLATARIFDGSENKVTVDIADLAPGMYILKVNNSGSVTIVKR